MLSYEEIIVLDELTCLFPSVQAFVVTDPADIFYLTGFYCEDSMLLYSLDPVLVTDSRYAVASRSASCRTVICHSYIEAIAEEAKSFSALGFQEESLTAKDYLYLSSKGFELIPIGGILMSLRASKSEDEVKKIIAAQEITDKAFYEILEYIKPGVTEKQVRAKLEYIMFSLGADGLAFDTIVASGENGAKPHAVPSDRVIQSGEFVTLDFGARLDNYNSDMTRTVAVGNISDEMKRIYSAVLEAHSESTKLLAHGAVCSDIDAAAREALKKYGLDKYFAHSLGHGVGIQIHEEPRLSPKNEQKLVIGNIVTVEPGVYIDGFCGVRIENMYIICENSKKNLTNSDKNLIIL